MVATVNVTTTVLNQSGSAVAGAVAYATLSAADLYNGQYIQPVRTRFVADSLGLLTMALFPNALGGAGPNGPTFYNITVLNADETASILSGTAVVPNANTTLSAIWNTTPAPLTDPQPAPTQVWSLQSGGTGGNSAALARANLGIGSDVGVITAVTSLVISYITAGQVPFMDAQHQAVGDSGLTWNNTTKTLNATHLTRGGVAVVTTDRTINGINLAANLVLTYDDVGAPPATRTINGKALTGDITLAAVDIADTLAGTGAVSRTEKARNAERPSVLDYGAVGDGGGVVDPPTGTLSEQTNIRKALVANPGTHVMVPGGHAFNTSGPIVVGGPGGTAYHGIQGRGYPNYHDAKPSLIVNTNGTNGIQVDNGYCYVGGMRVNATHPVQGSDPTIADFKDIGIRLSGGGIQGGASTIENNCVENFTTGYSNDDAFLAYDRLLNNDAIGNEVGLAITGSVTDFRWLGGQIRANTKFGAYFNCYKAKLIGTLFESNGLTTLDKANCCIRADGFTQLSISNCELADDTTYFCNRGARMTFDGSTCLNGLAFFGPGEFRFGECLGVPIEFTMDADIENNWTKVGGSKITLTNTDTAAHPDCCRVQSTDAATSDTLSIYSDMLIKNARNRGDVNDRWLTPGAYQAKHYIHAWMWVAFAAGAHAGPTTIWDSAHGFLPFAQLFDYAGNSDNFSPATNTQVTAYTFSDHTEWMVNMIFCPRWGSPYIQTMAQKLRVFIAFSDGTIDFSGGGNALDCYVRAGGARLHVQPGYI